MENRGVIANATFLNKLMDMNQTLVPSNVKIVREFSVKIVATVPAGGLVTLVAISVLKSIAPRIAIE